MPIGKFVIVTDSGWKRWREVVAALEAGKTFKDADFPLNFDAKDEAL